MSSRKANLRCVLCGRGGLSKWDPWVCLKCREKTSKRSELERVHDKAMHYSEAVIS